MRWVRSRGQGDWGSGAWSLGDDFIIDLCTIDRWLVGSMAGKTTSAVEAMATVKGGRVAVIGASGYGGLQTIRLLQGHSGPVSYTHLTLPTKRIV